MCDDTTERSGQASDKPRGRKPRDALALLGLWGFGCLRSCSRARSGHAGARRWHGDVQSRHYDSGFLLMKRSESDRTTTQGKAVHYRRCPMKTGRTVGATLRKDHAAIRCVGGARIGCPRAKVSMMSIAAPQCWQMNVGGMVAMGSSRCAGSAVSGTTCSSSRARARLPLRPVLAISP